MYENAPKIKNVVKVGDVFFKYLIKNPVVKQDDELEIKLEYTFFLAYFNILNIYRRTEPDNFLLKPFDDGKKYTAYQLTDLAKNHKRFRITGGADTDELNKLYNFDWDTGNDFYEKVEVENTPLLQMLLSEIGDTYNSYFYSLSHRQNSYSHDRNNHYIPKELESVFNILGIATVDNSSYNEMYSGIEKPITKQNVLSKNPNTTIRKNCINIDNDSFSLMNFLLNVSFQLYFLTASDAQKELVDMDKAILLNYNSSEGPYYYNIRSRKNAQTPSLVEFLSKIVDKKDMFINRHKSITVKKEIKNFIEKRLTNEDKINLHSFSNSDFTIFPKFRELSNIINDDSKNNIFDNNCSNFYHYFVLGPIPQLYSAFKQDSSLRNFEIISPFFFVKHLDIQNMGLFDFRTFLIRDNTKKPFFIKKSFFFEQIDTVFSDKKEQLSMLEM